MLIGTQRSLTDGELSSDGWLRGCELRYPGSGPDQDGVYEPGELSAAVLQSCLDTTQPQIMMMVFSIVRLIVVSWICVWMVGILAIRSVSDDCR